MTQRSGQPKAMYITFGCKLNFSETSTMAATLSSLGVERAGAGEVPRVVVINSCSVTEAADRKCRQAVRSLHRRYPEAGVFLTGCYAELKPDEAAALPGVVCVVPSSRKADVPHEVMSWLQGQDTDSHLPALNTTFSPSCSRGDRTRFFLKVQDGCDYFCTYCTIPAARGRSRSGTIAQLVAQAEEAAAQGGREIVITGVNIGDFGRRSDAPGETLLQLFKALEEVEGIDRYRISSLEPDHLTDEILAFCAGSSKFMPHFHIPLQSGSDAVLRLMHRHYDTALFRDKVEKIHSALPDAFIGIDLMVGPRGETPQEFERSVEFIKSLPITRLHVFPYSERPGTKALEIPYVVDPAVKRERVEQMIALSETLHRQFAERYLGTTRPVLLEHPRKGHPLSGFTDNYLKVRIPGVDPALMAKLDNTIRPVRLDEVIMASNGEPEMRGSLL